MVYASGPERPLLADLASTLLARLTQIRSGEWRPALASASYFALVLFGYFLLRPAREAMGVARSMDDLRWLFVATCVASALVVLLFAGVVSRLDRARFIAIGHAAVAACILAFVAARGAAGDETRVYLGYGFYVWLSVVNLFLTSVFWAFMADVWSPEACKRVFPPIAVGGTLGALAGSSVAWQLAERIGASWQLILAAVCFLLTIPLVRRLDARERRASGRPAAPVGGTWLESVACLVTSPYLLGIGAYVVLIAVSATFLYFTRANLIANASEELEARVSMFAQMDAWTQAATLFVQLFVTGRLIRGLGVGPTLAILPFVTLAGFALLAWLERRPGIEGWQLFAALAAFSALHSATRYAVARPTRETLFSVVSETERYKVKPLIDVFLFRGGDVVGAWATGLVAGLWGMLLLTLPMAAVWGGVSIALAAAQTRRAAIRKDGQDGALPREGAIG